MLAHLNNLLPQSDCLVQLRDNDSIYSAAFKITTALQVHLLAKLTQQQIGAPQWGIFPIYIPFFGAQI